MSGYFATAYVPEKENYMALEGIRLFKDYLRSIGMPATLSDLGVRQQDIHTLAMKCTENDTQKVGRLRLLGASDVEAILNLANS